MNSSRKEALFALALEKPVEKRPATRLTIAKNLISKMKLNRRKWGRSDN